ncbi:MAG: hypothetical protein BWY73_01279 [candidate division TA06 bacterium ADurb.Bin417]|uniref:Uncharacterized protein n=1 Tax=candidate division TA06 bacterium ADurb.Bin417 TaxID=1852828 RepID=A0A1V5MCS4_UNCT6|nr:MAG: hypothetical protein BWY73_01279 [candidate division TA06 bacterium ADurb.Bin417]
MAGQPFPENRFKEPPEFAVGRTGRRAEKFQGFGKTGQQVEAAVGPGRLAAGQHRLDAADEAMVSGGRKRDADPDQGRNQDFVVEDGREADPGLDHFQAGQVESFRGGVVKTGAQVGIGRLDQPGRFQAKVAQLVDGVAAGRRESADADVLDLAEPVQLHPEMAKKIEGRRPGDPAGPEIAPVEGVKILVKSPQGHVLTSLGGKGQMREPDQLQRLVEAPGRRPGDPIQAGGQLTPAGTSGFAREAPGQSGEGLQGDDGRFEKIPGRPRPAPVPFPAGPGRQPGNAKPEQVRVMGQGVVETGPEVPLPPFLMLGQDRLVLGAPDAFRKFFRKEKTGIAGQPLARLEGRRQVGQHRGEGPGPENRLRLPGRSAVSQDAPVRTQVEFAAAASSGAPTQFFPVLPFRHRFKIVFSCRSGPVVLTFRRRAGRGCGCRRPSAWRWRRLRRFPGRRPSRPGRSRSPRRRRPAEA